MRIKARIKKAKLLKLSALALILLSLLSLLTPYWGILNAEEESNSSPPPEINQSTETQAELPQGSVEDTTENAEAGETLGSENNPIEVENIESTETSAPPLPSTETPEPENPAPAENQQNNEISAFEQVTEEPLESDYQPKEEVLPQIPDEDIYSKIPGRLNVILPVMEEEFISIPRDKVLNFNPYLCKSEFSQWIAKLLYAPLISKSEENSFELLENYQYIEEEKELRLELKDDLHWGDNSVLSSRDLHFTFSALVKNPQLHPAGEILQKLKEADKYIKEAQTDEVENPEPGTQVVEIEPVPFADIAGIICHNDKELSLYFRKKLNEDEIKTLLSVIILPTKAWWAVTPESWENLDTLPLVLETSQSYPLSVEESENKLNLNENGENPLYDAASYELYTQIFDENKQTLEFKALEKYLSQSTIPRALDARISIRPEIAQNLANTLLQSDADIAVFPTLNEDLEAELNNLGYSISDVESHKILLVDINPELEDNIWLKKEMRKALLSLLPNAKELRGINYSKLRAPVLNAADLGEDAFWQSFLKAGYYANTMPENLLVKAQEQKAELAGDFRLLYQLDDEDSQFLARHLEAKFNALGIYPICYGVSTNDLKLLSGELDRADIFVHAKDSFFYAANNNSLPAYRKMYKLASKDIDEPMNLLLFQK